MRINPKDIRLEGNAERLHLSIEEVLRHPRRPFTFASFERQIFSNIRSCVSLAISGDLVAYADDRSGDFDVYVYDLATGQETSVTGAPTDQATGDISGGRVVHEDLATHTICLYDTAIRVTTTVSDTPAGIWAREPAIGEHLVVWVDARNVSLNLYARDLDTNEVRSITTAPDTSGANSEPGVSGDWIVWRHYVAPGSP